MLPLLRDLSARLADRYEGDCVAHAEAIARCLLEGGEQPWIGVIRDITGAYHAPLIPLRYAGRGGPTWNAHYVACCGGDAYEPLGGDAIPVEELAERIFGRTLPVTKVVNEADLARLLTEGGFRAHMATLRRR